MEAGPRGCVEVARARGRQAAVFNRQSCADSVTMYSLWLLRDSPDTLILVGSGRVHQFAGHRTLLASHSGYLKAQLTPGTSQVVVPSVAPEVFAPLLTFMYTGYLDLTPDNIYAVLLATHLLHMPRALDLCRAYLLHAPPVSVAPAALVKPVPTRPYWTPPTLLPPAPAADTVTSAPPQPVPSTSAAAPSSSPPASLSPCLSDASDQVTVTLPAPRQSTKRDGKVIVDVACCDGPVKFHRVLNSHYESRGEDKGEAGAEVYACQFCEHTFKSHYCYEKHARRHLHPAPHKNKPKPPKREARLLDTNVQYYPCKVCGSKFPSYYFVHKHRKMCHPHHEESTASTSQAPEPSPCTSPAPSDSETSELTV